MAEKDKLSNVRAAFDWWRNGRVKRQSIPDELWQMAVASLENYRISHVAKELGLNARQLREKQRAFNEQKTKIETQEKTSFIELNQFLPNKSVSSEMNTASLELQIERADGTRLTLSLKSSQSDILQNLVTAFISV